MIYKCSCCGTEFGTLEEAQICEDRCMEAWEKRADEAAAEARAEMEMKASTEKRVNEIKDLLQECVTNINRVTEDINAAYNLKKGYYNDIHALIDELKGLCPELSVKFNDEFNKGCKIEISEKVEPKKVVLKKKNNKDYIDELFDLMFN